MSDATPTLGVTSADRSLSYKDAGNDRFDLRGTIVDDEPVGLRTDDAATVLAALDALDGWAGEVHLLDRDDTEDRAYRVLADADLGTAPAEAEVQPPRRQETTWVLRSDAGPARFSLATLQPPMTPDVDDDTVWGLLDAPTGPSGVQSILVARATDRPAIAPRRSGGAGARFAQLADGPANAVVAGSETWSELLAASDAGTWAPDRAVVLGDDAVAGLVADRFPNADVTALPRAQAI